MKHFAGGEDFVDQKVRVSANSQYSDSQHPLQIKALTNLFLSTPSNPGISALTNSVIPTSTSLVACAFDELELSTAGTSATTVSLSSVWMLSTFCRLRGDSTISSLSILTAIAIGMGELGRLTVGWKLLELCKKFGGEIQMAPLFSKWVSAVNQMDDFEKYQPF